MPGGCCPTSYWHCSGRQKVLGLPCVPVSDAAQTDMQHCSLQSANVNPLLFIKKTWHDSEASVGWVSVASCCSLQPGCSTTDVSVLQDSCAIPVSCFFTYWNIVACSWPAHCLSQCLFILFLFFPWLLRKRICCTMPWSKKEGEIVPWSEEKDPSLAAKLSPREWALTNSCFLEG